MIDGKVFGVMAESSTQTCGICGATPKLMNNLEQIMKRIPNENLYNLGLSTLHAWEKFRSEMGLLLDIPKPGFGTTNDGNTARRFFKNPRQTLSITGIDEDLIYK
ncbi:uncharacterized protein LOC144478082 isoform X2 [Augochlora pura]